MMKNSNFYHMFNLGFFTSNFRRYKILHELYTNCNSKNCTDKVRQESIIVKLPCRSYSKD